MVILEFLLSPLMTLLNSLPTITLDTSGLVYANFFNAISMVGYFLPMGTVLSLLLVTINIVAFRIIMATIRFFTQFI